MGVSTQMNFRIDSELKLRGDRAIGAAGLTPSEAVRALWTYAARHMAQPQQIREALGLGSDASAAGRGREAERKIAALRAGREAVADGYARLGIPFADSAGGTPSLGELREQALVERQRERDLS